MINLLKLTVLALPVAGLTLGAAPLPNPKADWANLHQLAAGSEIRVVLSGGRTLRGFLQSTTAEGLAVNAATSQEKLPREDVRRVSLKRPGHRGRNTLIGLAVGMGAGFAAGAAIDHGARDSWLPNAGKIVLTPLGAIVGTVVGVAMPTGRWREIYRAP